MKIQIEGWAEKNLTTNAVELMMEAVMCYKVGADRAAYLLSYLAFKTTIRERILMAVKPDTITDKCWEEQIIKPLDNDNKWEEKLNNIVAASKEDGKAEGAIFRFTNYERIKNRYEYWKNIRNSCAHAKDEHITSSTVEQFWNYMQDDLPEFYVLGGKTYLLDRLCYSYKYYHTVGSDGLKNILREIALVYKRRTIECFMGFYEKNRLCLTINSKDVEFWKTIVNTDIEIIRDAFIDFLYKNMSVFVEWYEVFPQIFEFMLERHKSFIQEHLSPFLKKGWYIEENTFWKLLTAIIRVDVNLIELDIITNDYNKFRMIKNMNLESLDIDILRTNKVFNKFLLMAGAEYFKNDSTSHWNYYKYDSIKNDEFSEKCFDYIEWDIDIIEKLNSSYKCLDESINMRENEDSKRNGRMRKKSYDFVIKNHQKEIEEIIHKNCKKIEEYVYIEKSLKSEVTELTNYV